MAIDGRSVNAIFTSQMPSALPGTSRCVQKVLKSSPRQVGGNEGHAGPSQATSRMGRSTLTVAVMRTVVIGQLLPQWLEQPAAVTAAAAVRARSRYFMVASQFYRAAGVVLAKLAAKDVGIRRWRGDGQGQR